MLTAEPVINVIAGDYDFILLSSFFDNKFLVFYRLMRIPVKNKQGDIAYSIFNN